MRRPEILGMVFAAILIILIESYLNIHVIIATPLPVTPEPWGERLQVQAHTLISGNPSHDVTALCDRGNGMMLYIVTNNVGTAVTPAVIKQEGGCAKFTAEK